MAGLPDFPEAYPDAPSESAAATVVRSGSLSDVQRLDHDEIATWRNANGESLLFFAVQRREELGDALEITRHLLEKTNLEVDHAETVWSQTPLFHAARRSSADVAAYLLDLRANPRAEDTNLQTPLFYAAASGNVSSVEVLLERRAHAGQQDRNGQSPLFYAAKAFGAQSECVQVLLRGSSDRATQAGCADVQGRTPLIYAAQYGNELTCSLLLDTRCSIDHVDDRGQSALSYAAASGRTEILKIILGRRADLNSQDKDGQSPLIHAATNRNLEVCRALAASGADLHVADAQGRTAAGAISAPQSPGTRNLSARELADFLHVLQPQEDSRPRRHQSLRPSPQPRNSPSPRNSPPSNVRGLPARAASDPSSMDRQKKRKLGSDQTRWGGTRSTRASTRALFASASTGGLRDETLEDGGDPADSEEDVEEDDPMNGAHPASPSERSRPHTRSTAAKRGFSEEDVDENDSERGAANDAGTLVPRQPSEGYQRLVHVVQQGSVVEAIAALQTAGLAAARETDPDSGRSLLHMAAARASGGDTLIVRLCRHLIEQCGIDPCAASSAHRTALFDASIAGDADVCAYLIARACNPNAADSEGRTPLHTSAQATCATSTRLLLERHADVEAFDSRGQTPLNCALKVGKAGTECVQLMLDARASASHTGPEGQTPLMFAASSGAADLVRTLLAHRANANAADVRGKTPLFFAVLESRAAAATALLDVGALPPDDDARIDWDDMCCTNIVDMARDRGLLELLERLETAWDRKRTEDEERRAAAAAKDRLREAVLTSARKGSGDQICLLLAQGACAMSCDEQGSTALHLAARRKDDEAVGSCRALLASSTVKPDALDADGHTPLFYAVRDGLEGCVGALLDGRCDPDFAEDSGETPLFEAARGGRAGVSRLLIGRGASVHHRSQQHDTAVLVAVRLGNADVLACLLENGADPNITDESGQTALFMVSTIDCARALLNHRGNAEAKNASQQTPLFLHTAFQRENIVCLLLERSSRADACSEDGSTALHHASGTAIPSLLLKARASVNACDANQQTALFFAGMSGDVNFIRVLAQSGAEPNAVDVNRQTALFYAARAAPLEVICELVAMRADPTLRDKSRHTAEHVAKQGKGERKAVIDYLSRCTAQMPKPRIRAQPAPSTTSPIGISSAVSRPPSRAQQIHSPAFRNRANVRELNEETLSQLAPKSATAKSAPPRTSSGTALKKESQASKQLKRKDDEVSSQVSSQATKKTDVDSNFTDGEASEIAVPIMTWLQEHSLDAYAKELVEAGYDTLNLLQDLREGEVEEMLDAAECRKPGHRAKFRRALEAIKSRPAISPVGN